MADGQPRHLAPPDPAPCRDRSQLLHFPDLSYSQQYDLLYQRELDAKKVGAGCLPPPGAGTRVPRLTCPDAQVVPKPNRQAQELELAATRVALSDVFAVRKRNRWLQRSWEKTDFVYAGFMLLMHGLALAAPFTFSWANVGLFVGAPPAARSAPATMLRCASCRSALAAAGQGGLPALDRGQAGRAVARRHLPRHGLPGHHAELPPAAEPPQLRHAQVAGVRAGLLRGAGHPGRPHRVGVQPPLPPPAHGHPAGPPLPLRGLLVVPHGLAAGQQGAPPSRGRRLAAWPPAPERATCRRLAALLQCRSGAERAPCHCRPPWSAWASGATRPT